jgi:hypothetical protein
VIERSDTTGIIGIINEICIKTTKVQQVSGTDIDKTEVPYFHISAAFCWRCDKGGYHDNHDVTRRRRYHCRSIKAHLTRHTADTLTAYADRVGDEYAAQTSDKRAVEIAVEVCV